MSWDILQVPISWPAQSVRTSRITTDQHFLLNLDVPSSSVEPISQTYVNELLGLSIKSARALSPQFYDTDPLVALDIVYAEHETKEFIRQSKAYADKCSKTTTHMELTEVQSRHHFDIMYDIAHADTALFQQLSVYTDK